jgi:methylaspartate mutase epsilon subunit
VEIEVIRDKLPDSDFFEERAEVLSQWPSGKEVELSEAIDYHAHLSDKRSFLKVVSELHRFKKTVNFPRGGTPTLEDQIALNRRMVEVGVPLIPITTDSYTRNGDFKNAQKRLEESIHGGTRKLNGYPLVNHGVRNTRRVLEANEAAYCGRFNGADNRLLTEIGLASGMTSLLLDPFEVFGSYTKTATVEECIRNYQYSYRLAGHYTEAGIPITPDLIGWLPNGPFPYSVGLVCQIVASIIAAEQGVRSTTVNVQTQGNFAQDLAGIRSARKLLRSYLDEFGYSDFVIPGVFAAPVPIFPSPEKEHTALTYMVYSSIIGALGGAEAVVVRTVDEAVGIPTVNAHAVSYESANWVFSVIRQQNIDLEKACIEAEEDMIEKETTLLMDAILNLGNGNVASGFAKAVARGVIDSPMSPNINSKGAVLGIRDANGAARYLDFGNLPFPHSVKDFHIAKVAERAKVENREMDYSVSIEDFWAFSKGRILG